MSAAPEPKPAAPPAAAVQSVDRTLDLFEALLEAGAGVPLGVLSERVKLPRGTTHRLLSALTARGYARQDPETRAYALGYKVVDLATRIGPNPLVSVARPAMRALMEQTGETVNLMTLDRAEVVYAEQVVPERLVRMSATVGNRSPVHASGAGKALLAFRPPEQARALMAQMDFRGFTPRTITGAAAFERELEAIRERGWAVDNAEFEEGVRCVAAPVRNSEGAAVAGLSISGPASRVTPDRVPQFADKVCRAAARISQALGWRGPLPPPVGKRRGRKGG